MIAIADTGFVVAVMHRGDRYHAKAVAVYRQAQRILLLQPSLAEIAYLLERSGGSLAVAEFLGKIPQSKLLLTAVNETDVAHCATILHQYADSRIDFVDAMVMAVAERLLITTIFTIDYRDFRLYRPSHCPHFTLLPD
jgi:uncharacterized protein